MDFVASSAVITPTGPVDWPTVKAAILEALDLEAEYASLGIRFTGPQGGNRKNARECHAIDREDDVASAFVNVKTGVYHDSGGGGQTLSFWDFALKHGAYGRWIDVMTFYAARAGVDIGRPSVGKGGKIREATYLYRDANNVIRYAVFRYRMPNGKKSFSQHPPDGNGGWKYGAGCMDDVKPLPYRLPELAAAPLDETIFIFEGEKDVDRAASLDLTATTNHKGANGTDTTWPRFLEYFKGRPCVIVPDNDQSGWRHAKKVAAYLKGVASSVKILELPGLGPRTAAHGQDLSDWLDLGNTEQELGHLAYSAPEWDPESEKKDGPEPGPAHEGTEDLPPDEDVVMVRLSDVVAVDIEWLMPNRIPLGKLTLLAGLAKQGKSFLTIELASRVSVGGEVPCSTDGQCFPQGDVILLSAEDDLDDTVKPRLMAAGADTDRVHALTTVRQSDGSLGPFNLSYIPHLERAIVRLPDVKLVIIDPVTHYVGGKVDDHKVAQLRALLGPLKDLAARRHIAIVIVTHFNKGSGTNALHRVIGSSAYTALARANWIVMRDPKNPKRRLMLDAGTNLAQDPPGLAFEIVDGRIVWEESPIDMNANDALDQANDEEKNGKRGESGGGKLEAARDWLANLFAGNREIASNEVVNQGKAKGFSRDTIWKAKDELGIRAKKSHTRNGGWIWYLDEPPDTSDGSTDRHFDSSNGRNGHAEPDWGDGPPF